MPATPRTIQFSEDDFKERLSYDDLAAGDYEATLIEVEDIEASTTDNYGWGFVFQIKGLKLTSRVWLRGGGGWKVRQVFNALGQSIPEGALPRDLNPNPLIGKSCVVSVVRKPYRDGRVDDEGNAKTFVDIANHTPMVSEAVADFTDL
jgi:hypothetical protein